MRRKEKRVRMIDTQKETRIKNRPRKAKARIRKAAVIDAKAARLGTTVSTALKTTNKPKKSAVTKRKAPAAK